MACNTCTYSGLFNAFSVHLKNIHGEPKQTRLAKNILKCLSCNEIPITKTYYQIHTYWKHSASDTVRKLTRHKNKKSRDPRGPLKVEASIITKKVSETVKTEKIIEPQVNTDMTQEYYEQSFSPIKSEEETVDNSCDEISGDEEDSIVQNHTESSIKTEQFHYLCPISYCTFTTVTDTVRLLHLKSTHGILKDLHFLKMTL